MTARIQVDPSFELPAIAAAAGNSDVDGRWFHDGFLYVDGVSQEALDQAALDYDNDARAAAAIEASLIDVMNNHLDSVAGQRRYDNRFTCSLRAGFAGPFQSEGAAFAAWMDQCNMLGYTIMQEAKAGIRPVPTPEELIAAMPVIEWPPSPIPEGAV